MFAIPYTADDEEKCDIRIYVDANTFHWGEVIWHKKILTIEWNLGGHDNFIRRKYVDKDKELFREISSLAHDRLLYIVDRAFLRNGKYRDHLIPNDMFVWFHSKNSIYELVDTIDFGPSIAFEYWQKTTFTGQYVPDDYYSFNYPNVSPDRKDSANKIFKVNQPSNKQICRKYYELMICNLVSLTQPPYSLFSWLPKDVVGLLLDYLCRNIVVINLNSQ